MTNYKNMTNKEIKEQLEWSDPFEFGTDYGKWAFDELESLNKLIKRISDIVNNSDIAGIEAKLMIIDLLKEGDE